MAVTVEEGENITPNPVKSHEDICIRTSWVDAATALSHINKGRASGSRCALWVRKRCQRQLEQLGEFSERHSGKILFVSILIFTTFCVALKSAKMVTDINKLWVQEGGRLQQELEYVESSLGKGAGNSKQLLISTPKETGVNALHSQNLLNHLHILHSAINVTVNMYDLTWTLHDLCYVPSFPDFEEGSIVRIFDKLTPCLIITPLDCFWEGSKLLGPEHPVNIGGAEPVTWKNLNPQIIVDKMEKFEEYDQYFSFSSFKNLMKRAGITTGYMEKPCLNPLDPECPDSAPNKVSKQPPNVGAELTGGCYSYASKFMHWPEDFIVGGLTRNRTGHIVRGEALQSIVQLMESRDMYEFFVDDYYVHNIDWSVEKARAILDAWMQAFSEKVQSESKKLEKDSKVYSHHSFTSSSLENFLDGFSEFSIPRLAAGFIILVAYICLTLCNVSQPSRSQAGIGLAGVLLVAVSIASGLGLCALSGLPFNATITQILPFFMLGLGVDNMFLILHTADEVTSSKSHSHSSQVSEVLKRCGVSVVLTSLCAASAFCAAAIIPIPALRTFCLHAAILVMVNLSSMLLVFPAMISLDLKRKRASRADIFCCISHSPEEDHIILTPLGQQDNDQHRKPKKPKSTFPITTVPRSEPPKYTTVTRALPPPGGGTVTRVVQPMEQTPKDGWNEETESSNNPSLESLGSSSMKELVDGHKEILSFRKWWIKFSSTTLSLNWVLKNVYAPYITRGGVKAFSMFFFFFTVASGIWGVSQIRNGLDLTDVVPRGTPEFEFLAAQQKYFGFYNMHAVTKGNFEYPTNQQLLHDYYNAFTRVKYIIKNDDGGLPESWLAQFRDWLSNLQQAFDKDWKSGCFTQDRWYSNASTDGILAYKLLVQTGRVDHPIDRSLITQVRLVDNEGIINPKAFYNYLTAWYTYDSLGFSASQTDLRPLPRYWYDDGVQSEYDLKIPKSPALAYAALPLYLHNLNDTVAITEMIQEVREICHKFEEEGLPNFPTGIPFTFWEQYIKLRFYLILALVSVLLAVFMILSIVLMNIWAAALVVLVLVTLVLQLAGVLGILSVKLSAAPAVLLVIAVGIGVEFTVHITVGFLTSVGDRNRRVVLALTHMGSPVIHGAVSTLMSSIMLLFSEFDFIRRYFFYVLCALVLLGLLDGFIFLPVLLSILGPPAELISRKNPDRLPTPSPPPTPAHHHSSRSRQTPTPRVSGRGRRSSSTPGMYPRFPHHGGSNLSLTTISEEPGSVHSSQSLHSSHEIVVEPQVVVETTTYPPTCSGSSSSGDTTHHHHEGGHVTTKVTATAKVKVELHTPMSSQCGSDPSCRSSSSCSGGSKRSSNSRKNSPQCSTNSSTSSCSSTCSKEMEQGDTSLT